MKFLRFGLSMILLLMFGMLSFAQENPTNWNEALRRIEAVRARGAKELDLSGLGLYELPSEILELQWLEILNLSENKILVWPETFGQLENLRELSLAYSWETVNEEGGVSVSIPLFLGASFELLRLEILDLSSSALSQMPNGISRFSNLRELNLSDNYDLVLPEDIDELQNLEILRLNRWGGSELPEAVYNLVNLRELSLEGWLWWHGFSGRGGGNFGRFSGSIGRLRNLEILNLRHQALTSLPEEFGQLSSLRELYLYENFLTGLPRSIGNLGQLEILWLGMNQIETLPEEIGQLSNLKELDLRLNQLQNLPDSIGGLSSLRELYISFNPLEELPASIGNLASLETLGVAGTRLRSLPLP